MPLPDKRKVIVNMLDELSREIELLSQAARNTHEAATHEEAKPENDKDTRSIEAAYLAGAQAERVRDLERLSVMLERLELKQFGPDSELFASALLSLESEGTKLHCLLAPQGGGLRTTVDGVEIQIVTPSSPLGRALLGCSQGDVISLNTKGREREYEIVEVS